MNKIAEDSRRFMDKDHLVLIGLVISVSIPVGLMILVANGTIRNPFP